MATQTLHGACACGRNRYVVEIPQEEAQLAELRYDKTTASRYHSAAPLTLWLRVPLLWFTSATFAQHPDETRNSIRRSFVSPFSADTHRRQFCGYCGTQLSSWNERTRDEADHICLTVGSLLDEDQALLGELGFLPGNDSSDDEISLSAGTHATSRAAMHLDPQDRGAPWFEEMVQNTPLGRLKQQRGGHSGNGVQVEWEIIEWTEGDDADDEGQGALPGKRKIGDVEAGEDAEMRGL